LRYWEGLQKEGDKKLIHKGAKNLQAIALEAYITAARKRNVDDCIDRLEQKLLILEYSL
jgi:hypothetical protein